MTPFEPAPFVREVEEAAEAAGWTINYLSPCASSKRPWLQRTARSGPGAPRFYLSAGIHGDEIAGPHAALQMLCAKDLFDDFNTTIFPILNPEGLARATRANLDEIDLNRDYRDTKSEEVRSHIEALKTLGRFDMAIMLHEDYEESGAYLYELNNGPIQGLGKRMIAAMGQHVPIDERPEIEEVKSIGGIIQRSDIILKHGPIEDRPEWPEAIYLTLNHTDVAYTTESPMLQPLAQRVQSQIAAVRTALNALKEAAGYG